MQTLRLILDNKKWAQQTYTILVKLLQKMREQMLPKMLERCNVLFLYKSLDISEEVREWGSEWVSKGVRNDLDLYLVYVYIYTSRS